MPEPVSVTDSSTSNSDTITDFQSLSAGGNDKIDLSVLLLDGFIGTAGFDTSDLRQVRAVQRNGNTFVFVDTDTDSTAELVPRFGFSYRPFEQLHRLLMPFHRHARSFLHIRLREYDLCHYP